MAVVGAVALYRMRLRPWMYTWGADDDEVTAVLPGDELVSSHTMRDHAGVDHRRTHCGGVALAGADRRGPRRLLQLFVAGTGLWARTSKTQTPSTPSGRTCTSETPSGSPAATASCKAGGGRGGARSALGADVARRLRAGAARHESFGCLGLLSSAQRRVDPVDRAGSGGAVGHVAFDVPHFVMEQKMMRGIRDRAEQTRRDQVHAFVRYEYQGGATNTSSLVKNR